MRRMTGFGWIRMAVYLLLGITAIIYGLFVRCAATGSDFYRIWIVGGIVLLLMAACVPLGVWGRVPGWVRVTFSVLVILGLGLLTFIEILVIRHFNDPEQDVDVLIILGAQVKEDRPSLVLGYRLDKAIEYLNEHPDIVCIVSGGQGPNEPFSEAEGMYRYLTEHGIAPERIIKEERSANTIQNIAFSKKLIPEGAERVGILTNNFHIYRATAIAKKQGIKGAVGIVAPSKKEYLPTNLFREFFGVLKDFLLGNM
ncbi:MAG: YdcF family protein [Lachnospiraceae bacterium]|nr:YdcF family protein [Lachnospiraceae bacterium]